MRNVVRICKLAGLQLILTLQVYSQYAYSSTRNIATQGPEFSPRSQEDKQSLLTVLKELNKARGVYFLYSEESVGNKMVNPVRDMKAQIETILDGVLDNTGLKYKKVSENTFVILKGKEKVKDVSEFKPLVAPTGAITLVDKNYASPYQTITGRVVGADGGPLSGVSVRVKGTNNGTTTNVNGEFSIQANKGDILVFSYVGLQAQEVPVNENTDLRITMSATTQQMSEVIVTALGVRKDERRLGYAVGKIPGGDLTQAREINLGNALEGRVAGVNSTLQLTGPGGSSNVLIRGNVSLNGLSQPLYVINGVPMSNDQLGSAGMWGGADLGDALTSINPDDIESITVLKGAAAAALYGQLAKNGVILITTKSGRAKKALGIEVNSNVQIDKINHFLDFQNVYGQGTLGAKPTDSTSAQNTGLSSWGAKLDGSSYIGIDGKQHTYSDQGDNLDRFYRTGSTFSNTVALSGGSDAGSYRFSLGDLRSNSVYPNSQYIRNTANLSLNYRMSEHWSGEANILYTKETGKNRSNLSDAPGNGNFAIGFLPPNVNADWLKPGYDANGNEIRFSSDAFSTNPFFAANKFQNNTAKNKIFGVASLRFSPVNWIYIQGRLTNDFYNFNATQITPTGTAYRPGGSLDNEEMINSNQFNADVLVNGSKRVSHDDIGISLSLGANYLRGSGRSDYINATGFAFPFLYNPSTATTRNASTGTYAKEVQSVYGELELSFKNSIFLSITDRNDWSSALPVANNSYNYPSSNISYVFTENFKPSWLNFGKIRAGIAQIGNDTDPYQTLLYYNTQGSINGQPLGSIGSNIPNNALQPTKIKEYEVGLEDLPDPQDQCFLYF
jgi:TonB-linked SusC/RagA family outer membrane protein